MIDVPGARFTVPHGIDRAGQIVGGFGPGDGGPQRGFLRDTSGNFTTIAVPGASLTEVRGINADGEIVGWFADAAGRAHGFLLSAGSFTTIGVPGALDTFIHGINDSGQMAGQVNSFDGRTSHGLLGSAGSFTTFDVPGATNAFGYGITSGGQIAGIFFDQDGCNTDLFGIRTAASRRSILRGVLAPPSVERIISGRSWDFSGTGWPHGASSRPLWRRYRATFLDNVGL